METLKIPESVNVKSNIAVIIKTAKNRLRYFDTTFNSVRKTLPAEVPLYIMADVPDEIVLKYITTNDDIPLDPKKSLYPNDLPDWKNKIGFIENKTSVQGILGKYVKHYVNHELHLYEFNNFACRAVAKETDCTHIIVIEDDAVFKADWFTKVLELLKQPGFDRIGFLSLFAYRPWAQGLMVRKLYTEFKLGNVGGVAFVLNVKHFKRCVAENYAFNVVRDFLSMPIAKKQGWRETFKNGALPTGKRDPLYNRNQDGWFIKELRKSSVTGIINVGVCQHIGVESCIYANVKEGKEDSMLARSFFTKNMELKRIDKALAPPYVI